MRNPRFYVSGKKPINRDKSGVELLGVYLMISVGDSFGFTRLLIKDNYWNIHNTPKDKVIGANMGDDTLNLILPISIR